MIDEFYLAVDSIDQTENDKAAVEIITLFALRVLSSFSINLPTELKKCVRNADARNKMSNTVYDVHLRPCFQFLGHFGGMMADDQIEIENESDETILVIKKVDPNLKVLNKLSLRVGILSGISVGAEGNNTVNMPQFFPINAGSARLIEAISDITYFHFLVNAKKNTGEYK